MKNKLILFIIIILFLILTSFSVHAVGIAAWDSVVKEVDFIPNGQKVYPYLLKTTVNYPLDYELTAEGPLANLVTFAPNNILEDIQPNQNPWFNVIINFPASEGNLTPGIHTITIKILEGSGPSDGWVGGRSGLTFRILVRILHPGKYLKAGLNVPHTNINEPVKMNVDLENWGKQIIDTAQAKIDVYTKEGEFKDTITTDSVSVPAASRADAYAVLDTLGYPPGDYYAEGIVTWDGQQTPVNDTFRIGTQDVKVNSYTATFEQNKINPFKINIESIWNSHTPNVYATINLPNGPIQTPTLSLSPWQNINLTAYWETTEVELGTHDAVITLHYDGQTKTKKVKVEVLEKVEVQEQKPIGFNYLYLILIIVALILANVFIWVFFIRKKKNKEETFEPQGF